MPSSEPGMLENVGGALSNVPAGPCLWPVFTYAQIFFAWAVISLRWVVVCGCFAHLCVTQEVTKYPAHINHWDRAASCGGGLKARHLAFPSVLSVLNCDMRAAKQQCWNLTNLYTVRSDFKVIQLCGIFKARSLSVHYAPLCLPSAMCAGFGEMSSL